MAIFPNSGIKVITDYKPLVITFTPGKGSINGSGGNVTRETLAGSPFRGRYIRPYAVSVPV